ncbi:MAG: MobA/MobL family protein [Steroidobacteraceae bacterium]
MAICHLSVKAIGRAKGRSATATAAYRAAIRIVDERTGLVHDYARKTGVAHTEIVVPDQSPPWARDRDRPWNEAELAERRRNSTVAREFQVAWCSHQKVHDSSPCPGRDCPWLGEVTRQRSRHRLGAADPASRGTTKE